MYDTHANLEARISCREKADMRALRTVDRMDARKDDAKAMVGQLCREGRTVYYVTTRTGKMREAAHPGDLVDFLIRNNYA